MLHDILCPQVEEEPRMDQSQAIALLERYSRDLVPTAKMRGRPPVLGWTHLCLDIVLCFLKGWHHQRDLWRLLGWQSVGPFSPVLLTDQAIYNRLAHADEQMRRLFEAVSAWLRQYLDGWQDRDLAPFASRVLAVDESSLDQVARWLPNLRHLPGGETALLAGRICGLFDVRFQQWVRVELFPDARTNCKVAAWSM
jgi:hypothetical protein